MKTQFAILNPLNGTYTSVDTLEGAAVELASNAFSFYMAQAHNAPLSIVQTDEDGKETWYTATGERLPSEAEVLAKLKVRFEGIQSMQDAAALDITRLGE